MPPGSARAGSAPIGLVVEGPGDREAVPVLLRRHLHSRNIYRPILSKPVNCNGRDNAKRENGVEGFILTASLRPECAGVVLVLDAEKDNVGELESEMARRAATATSLPVLVVIADHYYEDWLYASAETLELGLSYNPDRRGMGEIKNALSEKYVKPRWQPRLTDRMDLSLARSRNGSFDKFLKGFDEMVDSLGLSDSF